MTPQPVRNIARRFLVSSALLAVAATPTASPAQRAAAARSCIAGPAVITPARLDSVHRIYVEQETVSAQRDGRVLVAGKPIYLWRRNGDDFDQLDGDSLIGIVVDRSFHARALISPLPGRAIGGVRAAAMDDGWWVVTFAEIVPAPAPKDPLVLGVWSGETDGVRWRSVERLPAVKDSMVTWSMSALFWRDGRTILAVPSRSTTEERPRRVVLFERRSGQWTANSLDFGLRSYVAVGASATHDVLAVIRPDTTQRSDGNSLFTYARRHGDSAWVQHPRIVRGGDDRSTHDPALLIRGDGLVISWRVAATSPPAQEAWFALLKANGDLTSGPVKLGDQAVVLSAAAGEGRAVWTALGGSPSDGHLTLKRFEVDAAGRAVAPVVSSSPYLGVLGMAMTRSHLMIAGSRQSFTPAFDPPFSTIIHAIPWRCPTR